MLKVFLLAALFGSGQVLAEVAVIVHPSNTATLGQDDIARIYTGKSKTFPGGQVVKPYNLAEGDAVRSEFNDKVVGRSDSAMKAYWSKLIFTGKGTPPEEVPDGATMLQKVASDPAAIGYVDGAQVNDTVRVVGRW
ncbi:MAG: phosphate ABC transporter substrate-binding protein [Gammaproteobacteria bacterium]|nr:MAG: phosphate ABC transporter substrate-binding protein [Gammaproteobacteria bacterium]